jgi:ubiquinone/menaquinone biosynthesis C-methylase UbiE
MDIMQWLFYKVYSRIVPNYYFLLRKEVKSCRTVIDLGCGNASPLKYIKSKNQYTVGVDRFEPYLKKSKERFIHDKYIKSDILKLDLPAKSFECAMALDVIEHFEKKEGWKLINAMERLAQKKIVLVTPNGFVPQEIIDSNLYQQHKSGYNYTEMKKMGFRVYGVNGHKALRKEEANYRYSPRWIWFIISEITQLYTCFFPKNAYQILCVKKAGSKSPNFFTKRDF